MIRKTILFALFFLSLGLSAFSQTANFTAASTSGCSPVVVNFQDQSSGTITTWLWDFGTGATSTLQNPSTTYFTPGVYTVKLTVTGPQGSNTLTKNQYVTVYGKPSVNFIVNDSVACFPHSAHFTDLSSTSAGTTNNSWLWDFGDGTQSSQQNPVHIYNAAGNYTVTLKVTNDKGCSSVFVKTSYIKISGGVQTQFSNTQPQVCRPPFVINFTNTSTGPGTLTWYWNFGDGNTSNQQNPSHTYNAAGNYTITLATTSSSGCTDTLRKVNALNILNIATAITTPDSVCINTPVNFVNNSTPAPSSANWQFGDGGSSSDINPVRAYPTAGTFTIKLYNSYSYCNDSATKTIKVNPRPVANFTSGVSTRCQPDLPVAFQDLSSNAVSWQWSFGDGGTSSQQNPGHIYTGYGDFDVKLIVTNSSGCTDSVIRPAYVRIHRPVISFSNLPVSGCIPYSTTMNANISTVTGDNILSYQWDFGDGNGSTQQSPSYTYTQQGAYTVKLTITTSTGCTQDYSVSSAVVVGRKPVVNFIALPNPACAFQNVAFVDQTNEGDSWQWSFGDGETSIAQNPLHQYTDTGLQTVRLIVTNSGCPDTLVKADFIRIKPPIARFAFQTNCINRLQFNFRDTSIGSTSWHWDFGDGTTSTDQHPVHFFPAFGTYLVTQTVTNDTCSNSITRPVRVIRESPDFVTDVTSKCRGSSFPFSATGANMSNIVSYLWNFGDGQELPATQNTSYYYANSGYYTVRLITTDIYGCKDTLTKPNYIRVNGPVANFNAINTSGCKGFTTQFNDQSTNDGISSIVSWKWDFGDGTVQNLSGGPFQHTYNTAGNYAVSLVVTDAGGCKDSINKPDLIHATNPRADFYSIDTMSCPNFNVFFTNTSTATNYTSSWTFSDGFATTDQDPNHRFVDSGYYTIRLLITDAYGCKDSLTKPNYVRVSRPVASFSMNDSISSCTPFEVQFKNTSYYWRTLSWDLAGGTSTLQDPVQFYSVPGVYTISLAVASPGGCVDTARKQVTVYDTAGSRITYLPLDGCKPLPVSLSAFTPGPMASYTWDYGDGVLITTTGTTSNHVYNVFGDYVPKVILTDQAGCVIPVSGLDTIKIKGAITKFGLDKKLFCDSGRVNFIDSTLFNDSLSVYNWDFGDGAVSHLQNPSHQYTSPGFYDVSLNVQTRNACVDTFRITAAIKVVESPLVSITGDSIVCINGSMTHAGVFDRIDTSVVRWLWQFPGGGTSSVQNPSPQRYTTAGTFTVQTIATNSSGCKDTATKQVRVNPLPVVNLPSTISTQAGAPVLLPATYSAGVVAYSWLPPATLSCTTCPQPVASPKFNTKYVVNVVDSVGCRNEGSVQVIVLCSNANVFIPNTFSPNGDGSNDVFYVRGKGLDRVKSIRIFNRWGEVVFEQQQFPVNDPAYGWNGKYKGNKPVPDVYVYQVEVFCDNSQIVRFEGNVALIQ